MICLIRHGEPSEGWGDHPDPGLSPLGLEQAARAASALIGFGLRRAVSSPLARCRETAGAFERLAETHARLDPAVGEIPTPASIADRRAWLQNTLAGKWSDLSETHQAWRYGVVEAVSEVPDGTAVFTHFVAINAVVGALTGDERVVAFRPGHASITILERRDGRLRVAGLGDEGSLKVL